ncbi:MAG: hypothetical protein ABI377_02790 [Devosia sp.]
MSGRGLLAVLRTMALAMLVAPLLGGCTYDYLQHTDRIGYQAGDAVAANLEGETINPSKRSMYVTSGLGKNGSVMPTTGSTSSTTTTTPTVSSGH